MKIKLQNSYNKMNIINYNDHLNIDRPDWDNIFMEMCETISKRSTCSRIKTASVIQKNNIVISIGYNGSVSNSKHCNEYWIEYYLENYKQKFKTFDDFIKSKDFYDEHHKWSEINELHGEMNAILQACKNGIILQGSTIYTLYSPCINCAKCIISSGITQVCYKNIYKRDTRGIDFLTKNNINCKNII
jgi:dCMP deaminase